MSFLSWEIQSRAAVGIPVAYFNLFRIAKERSARNMLKKSIPVFESQCILYTNMLYRISNLKSCDMER
jgi:hypothetical protein